MEESVTSLNLFWARRCYSHNVKETVFLKMGHEEKQEEAEGRKGGGVLMLHCGL